MAKKEFILQGLTARTHADAVRDLFDIPDIENVILSIAFVSESGVEEIESQLTANATCLSVFAGIRNDITVILTFDWTVFGLRDCNIFAPVRQGDFRYRKGRRARVQGIVTPT